MLTFFCGASCWCCAGRWRFWRWCCTRSFGCCCCHFAWLALPWEARSIWSEPSFFFPQEFCAGRGARRSRDTEPANRGRDSYSTSRFMISGLQVEIRSGDGCGQGFGFAIQLRHLKIRHRPAGKEVAAGFCEPAGPTRRASHSCAVGSDARVRVHLAVEFRDQHEGQAAFEEVMKLERFQMDFRL